MSLQKVKVLYGNDMQPCIMPNEILLLDKSADPRIGDVVLFENKFGIKIAHRLIHEFAGYYFTRGDNCPIFNFPIRKEKILGVIAGKSRKIQRKRIAELILMAFVPQFIIYSRLFDLKKKRYFFLLNKASGYYHYIEPEGEIQKAEVDENGKLLPIRESHAENRT